jgi:HEPN domain-containing protein
MSVPSRPNDVQWTEAARWLERVGDDLDIVDTLLRQPSPLLLGAALHCQQAAEKLAKATLIAFGASPPRIHDVDELAERVALVHADIGRELQRLGRLTAWYISSRYPDIAVEAMPNSDDIRQAVASLRRIFLQVTALAPRTP